MSKLSRRFFCSTMAMILTSGSLFAQEAPAPGDKKLAERYYQDALTMLKNGHWLDRCAEKLRYTLSVFPEKSEYHVTLGCALVSRLASYVVAYGERDQKNLTYGDIKDPSDARDKIKNYLKDQGKNPASMSPEEVQKALSAVFPESTPPDEQIVVLLTPDDNREHVVAKEKLIRLFHMLAEGAKEHWEKASTFAISIAEQRAALDTQIWGLNLLKLCHEGLRNEDLAHIFLSKDVDDWQTKTMEAVQKRAEQFPKEVDSWLIKGEILAKTEAVTLTQSNDEILASYKKALELDPNNSSIIFRLYQILENREPGSSTSEAYLRQFVEQQPGNAFAQYCLASFLAKKIPAIPVNDSPVSTTVKTQVEEVVRIINAGTVCVRYAYSPLCAKPVMPLLAAYAYFNGGSNTSAIVRQEFSEVSRVLTTYAKRIADSDNAYAERCCYSLLAMAKKIKSALTSVAGDVVDPSEQILEMIANAEIRAGYKSLLFVLKKGGNEDKYRVVEQEQNDFIAKEKARINRLLAKNSSKGN